MATTSHRIIFTLAWRNLWRNHRRTAVMLSAIIIGVWAMIFMTALMRGMVDDMLVNGIRNLPGEVQIHHPEYRDDPVIVNSIPMIDREMQSAFIANGVAAWAQRINVPAVISSERDSRGVILLGIEAEGERRLGFDTDDIIEGRFIENDDDQGIVIGRKLAERLETSVGKRVVIMSQDPENQIADRGFRIVGIYRADIESMEERAVYIGIKTAQGFLGMGDRVSEIALSRNDYRRVVEWFPALSSSISGDVEILPWYEIDTYLGTMLSMMDGMVLIWVVTIFIALSFGLVNTLVMAIYERVREIGLMQALGMKPAAIMQQIVAETFFLLIIGLISGNLIAVATILPLQDGIDISIVAEGMAMMGSSSILYPSLTLYDVMIADVTVIVLGLLTSFIPAWHASRFDPVVALNKH